MNVSVDGFMSGKHQELDWHIESWNSDMSEVAGQQLSRADTILLGRITYLAMAGYWPGRLMNLEGAREDLAFADMMNNYRKVVFSRQLTEVRWNNTVILKRNLVREVQRMKNEEGKEIIVYGSAQIAHALIANGLVDEFRLWIHPILLGKGTPLFSGLRHQVKLELRNTMRFRSGVIILTYVAGGNNLECSPALSHANGLSLR